MMYGTELQACQGATVELVDCLGARAAYWQAEVEEACSKALALFSGDRADRLSSALTIFSFRRAALAGD